MRFNEPSADIPLLCSFGLVLGVAAAFFALFFWAMQPTVLANAPYSPDLPRQAVLADEDSAAQSYGEDQERIAIEAAEQENEEQGFAPLAVASVPAPASPPPASVSDTPRPKPKLSSKPKPKVATVRRAPVASPPVQSFANTGHWMFW